MPDGLTPEQRAAVESLDADVCVSAGAGSGKTRVLVERFLKLALRETVGVQAFRRSGVQDPAAPSEEPCPIRLDPSPERLNARTPERPSPDVDEILAITFTRKAALEMKARIARALVERGCIEERRRLEVASISTIHTFCERVLRENPFDAGLDPDFTVLDEPEASLLLAQAYEQVLERAFAHEADPVADLALVCYDRRTQDGDGIAHLQENARKLLNSLAALGWSPVDVAVWAAEPLDMFVDRSQAFLREQLDPVIAVFREGIACLSDLTLGKGQMEENRKEMVGRWATGPVTDRATEVTATKAQSPPSRTEAGLGHSHEEAGPEVGGLATAAARLPECGRIPHVEGSAGTHAVGGRNASALL